MCTALGCREDTALFAGQSRSLLCGLAEAALRLAIFGPDGRALGEIAVPAPEITGLCLSGTGQLFITEASTGSVYAASV